MNKKNVLKDIEDKFSDNIVNIVDKSENRVYIDIKKKALVDIAEYTFKDLGARFNIATGLDAREHMEILYHFIIEEIDLLISFRVKLPKSKPLEVDSLTLVFKASNWIEREINEMLGINFKGHPDLRNLLLPDDWPEDVYPLRCDYKEWDDDAIRDRGVS